MSILDLRDLAKEFSDLASREDDADDPLDDDERETLMDLRKLADDLGVDGPDGMKRYADDEPTMIEDGREWLDYVEQLAEDIGAIDRSAKWPLNCIDWEKAARELAYDYSLVTYAGTDYYIRSV